MIVVEKMEMGWRRKRAGRQDIMSSDAFTRGRQSANWYSNVIQVPAGGDKMVRMSE